MWLSQRGFLTCPVFLRHVPAAVFPVSIGHVTAADSRQKQEIWKTTIWRWNHTETRGISGSLCPRQVRGRDLELHQTPWRRHPLPLCSFPAQLTLLPLSRDFVFWTLSGWRWTKIHSPQLPAANTGLSPCILRERRVSVFDPRGVGGSVHRGELETSQDHFSTKWTFEHPIKTHWAKLLPNIDLRKKMRTRIAQITVVFLLSLKSKSLKEKAKLY